MSERTLTVLVPEQVESAWVPIRKLLATAVEYCNGEFEVDDLLEMVLDGRAFVVVLASGSEIELAAVCERLTYPRKTVVNVLALGGKNFDLVNRQFWPKMVAVAEILGASAVRGAVRPVMERYCRRVAPDVAAVYTTLERRI